MLDTGKKRLFLLCALSIAAVAIMPFFGSYHNNIIFYDIRIPKVLLAFFVGAGLSINGAVFQTLFRNDLATPYILGVASAAAFGAAIGIQIGIDNQMLLSALAFLAALSATIIVFMLGRISKRPGGLLLAGIALNFFFASLILLMQYLANFTVSFEIIRWMMGDLSIIGYGKLSLIIPSVLLSSVVIYRFYDELNLFIAGEEFAKIHGVNVKQIKAALFFLTSLSTAIIVSVAGPIGFVGMMVPHIIKMTIGRDHKFMLIGTFFFGGLFLAVSNEVGRIIVSPAQIPVGIITSILGGPFFIWLLVRNAKL